MTPLAKMAEILGFCLTAAAVAAIFANAWIKIKTSNAIIKSNCLDKFKSIEDRSFEVEEMCEDLKMKSEGKLVAIARLETEFKSMKESMGKIENSIESIFLKLEAIWKEMPKRKENGSAGRS